MGKDTASPSQRPSRPLTPYEVTVRLLSDRIVEAQRPIRVLDAIKWDDSIEKAFFAAGATALPAVAQAYYESRPLPFDPITKREEFQGIEQDVRRQLGDDNELGSIMIRMCREY